MNLLSRMTYREVVRRLDYFRRQHEADRRDNPDRIPLGWGVPIQAMIESTVRKNHERYCKGLAEQVMDHLADSGILVRYHGDYTFPGEQLPSADAIRQSVESLLRKAGEA